MIPRLFFQCFGFIFAKQIIKHCQTLNRTNMRTSLLISVFILFPFEVFAQGDLLINPFRVVFEDGKTIEELTVANTGLDSATYTISFLQYKMQTDGVLKQIQEPEEGILFADRFIRFFPRSITLAPNEAQIVRIQARTPSGLQEAEYRSHLYFRSVVDESPDMGELADTTALGIQLIPVYGVSIPVIIRHGDLHVEASISDIAYIENADGNDEITFTVLREGNSSTFGHIVINHVSDAGGKTMIGRVNGIAVYTPLAYRKVNIPLRIPDELDIRKGHIQIKYSAMVSGREIIFFEYAFHPD